MTVWEGGRCGGAVGWWGWVVVDAHIIEGCRWSWCGRRCRVRASGGIERRFGGEDAHNLVVDIVGDAAVLGKILKLLGMALEGYVNWGRCSTYVLDVAQRAVVINDLLTLLRGHGGRHGLVL